MRNVTLIKNAFFFSLAVAALFVKGSAIGQERPTGSQLEKVSTFKSNRDDGRYINSLAITWDLIKQRPPSLSFNPKLSGPGFSTWQNNVKETMEKLVGFPFADMNAAIKNQPPPKMLYEMPRDGYRIQKWETYPLPNSVVTFLVLIPNDVNNKKPAPGVLCIPGTNGTKESLADEPEFIARDRSKWYHKNIQAIHFVKMGLVAVAVDEPGVGETADLELISGKTNFQYNPIAKNLLEAGWNYLGFSVFMDQAVLRWMKEQPFIDASKLIVSGHSLGTEPLMALGILDPSIYAFVYNDFLCNTRERQLAVTKPDANWNRPIPNHNISHSVPGFWNYFDFPDLCAALAPRPLIITEGGLERDLKLIKKAYEIAGKESNFQYYHYTKYADPTYRSNLEEIPLGIDRGTYLNMANVDPSNHYFKEELILPWLKTILSVK